MKIEFEGKKIGKEFEKELKRRLELQEIIGKPGSVVGVDSNEDSRVQGILNKPEAFSIGKTGLKDKSRDEVYKIIDSVIEEKIKILSSELQKNLSREEQQKKILTEKLAELKKVRDAIEKNDVYIEDVQNRLHPIEAEELLNEKLLLLRQGKYDEKKLEKEIKSIETELKNIDENIDNILNQANN
jgi:hypothetical protein